MGIVINFINEVVKKIKIVTILTCEICIYVGNNFYNLL